MSAYEAKRTEEQLLKECRTENKAWIKRAYTQLAHKKERDVIFRYYIEGETLQQIAEEYGCGREWIRQLKARGLRHIRAKLRKIEKE